MADKDTNPYYLRNVDLDKLDLSSYGKDYSPEELAAVKASLREVQNQHHAAYEALPLIDKAQIYASEKFGQYQKYAEQNPEIAFGAPAALATGVAVIGGQKLFSSLRDKLSSMTNSTAAPLPDDGLLAHQMSQKNLPVVAKPSTPLPLSQEIPPAAVNGIDKTPDQIRREKLAQAQAQIEGRPVPTAPAPIPSAQTMTPEQMIQASKPEPSSGMTAETNVGNRPKDMGLVERSAYNTMMNEASAAEKAAAPVGSAPAPATNKPVSPNKKKSTPEIKLLDTPQEWHKLTKEGSTFLPGYGAGDNNLFNTYGAEGRKAVLERFNNGKPIGSYDNYLALNEKLKKGVPSSEVPGLMSRLPSEAEAGTYGPLGKKAIIKGAGIGGLLLAAHELANAKTPTEAALRAVDIGTDYVPILGQIKQGLAPSELQSGKLTAKQLKAFEEAQKLGSPYRSVPPPR